MKRGVWMFLSGLTLAGSAQGQTQDPLAEHLFPPDLVMQARQQIDLDDDQRAIITEAIREFQGSTLELEWTMQDEVQRLAEILSSPVVDAESAMAQMEQVLDVERQVKRAHMGMLIRIKNTLSEAQQEFLRGLARHTPSPSGSPMRDPGSRR